MMGAILTVEQAAILLGVRPKTVRALAADGLIPAAKVGKPWRFDETLLREWLQARSRENVKPCPSTNAPIPLTGKSASGSLGARLDELLESQTEPPPRSSKKNFAVVSGGKSS
jgi:excisionase family DNA binding protein